MFSQVSFLNLNQKILFQGDYKSIKNLKKNRKYSVFNISQDMIKFIKWVDEALPENKKNDVTFRFLIFLFIITETKIYSKFWEKYTVFQLSLNLVITFHSCYFSLEKPIDSHWFKMSCFSFSVFSCVYCFFFKQWNHIKTFVSHE